MIDARTNPIVGDVITHRGYTYKIITRQGSSVGFLKSHTSGWRASRVCPLSAWLDMMRDWHETTKEKQP